MFDQRVLIALTHLGTALGAAAATTFWLSTHKVDVYALVGQLNIIVTNISTLITTVVPLATGLYAVIKAKEKGAP